MVGKGLIILKFKTFNEVMNLPYNTTKTCLHADMYQGIECVDKEIMQLLCALSAEDEFEDAYIHAFVFTGCKDS